VFCGGMEREVGGKGCGLEEGERRTGESRAGGISMVAGRGMLPIRRAKALTNARGFGNALLDISILKRLSMR